ncbi:MAG: MATE family efflux transporter [Clostridiales bacterium]|nr:MATE family efflux transporter [Clostridiales bacterium]
MNQSDNKTANNPLGAEPVGRLLWKFSIPSIIALLVSSFYNIVDQFFIGRNVGELGNAATNIAFPLTITCSAISLFFGMGGAAAFNLAMGKGEKDKAVGYLGNAAAMLFLCGAVLCIITVLFLEPMLKFFGSPDEVLEYAKTYTGIVAIGFPFLALTGGGGHLIRADGRPRASMFCNLSGAIINIFLDALFVSVLHYGMAGAAAATIIGQVISGSLAIRFLSSCQTVKLKKENLILKKEYIERVASLGAAPCVNQIAMLVVQISMNNSLKYYGGLSVYGSAIPIACVGIITKVNQIFLALTVGISQSMQPITSFNYGAEKYDRVRSAYTRTLISSLIIGICAFLAFQLFPRQIIALFGNGSEEYFNFAVRYFRVFLFFAFVNFMPAQVSSFFTSIGKPKKGMFVSLTRQVIFFLPLLLILPLFMGIDGIMYVGPIADLIAVIVSFVMVTLEFRDKKYSTA